MTPAELLIIVALFIVARLVLHMQPIKARSQGRSPVFAREYLDPFIFAGIAAFLLITFVARTYYIPSGSMEPTLKIGDVLLVNKFEYRFVKPREGDIVVFRPPVPSPDDFIKRVIGLPGDTLKIQNGTVYIDGKALAEPYVAAKPDYNLIVKNYDVYVDERDGTGYQPLDPSVANIPPKKDWTAPNRIPKNCYFMMGDNRNDSEDSHIWGFAQLSGTFATGQRAGGPAHFTGRAFLIFWPLSQARIL
ncbi:MAG: signal peptidase I [Vulcanimicrobiaceae bacterium]